MGTGSFPEVNSGRGVTLTTHPLLVPRSRKSRAIHLLPLWAVRPVENFSACKRVHFTFFYLLFLRQRGTTNYFSVATSEWSFCASWPSWGTCHCDLRQVLCAADPLWSQLFVRTLSLYVTKWRHQTKVQWWPLRCTAREILSLNSAYVNRLPLSARSHATPTPLRGHNLKIDRQGHYNRT